MDSKELAFLEKNHPRVYKSITEGSKFKDNTTADVGVNKSPLKKRALGGLKVKSASYKISDIDARILKSDIVKIRNATLKKGVLAATLSSTVLVGALTYFGVGLTDESYRSMSKREQAMKNFAIKALEIDEYITVITGLKNR